MYIIYDRYFFLSNDIFVSTMQGKGFTPFLDCNFDNNLESRLCGTTLGKNTLIAALVGVINSGSRISLAHWATPARGETHSAFVVVVI